MPIENINDIGQLKAINKALMTRVESAMDQQGNAFSLFQTAINLEAQVKRRTDQLTAALRGLEKINTELEVAKEASETANLSKTRFLAAASHDVLQPLNAAILSISVLADLQLSEQGKKLAHQIEHSLDTMSELLKTLLDISKLDAGVVQPHIEIISLQSELEALRLDFVPVAEKKQLDLRLRCRDINVSSDKIMLRRILQNLISNALKYTSKGGVLIGVRTRNGSVFVDITDTGSGISPDYHDQIFEEFHRGPLPRGYERASDSGLGLGLSIVKRMATTLNHDLQLVSVEDKGSRFRLTLPVSISAVKVTQGTNQLPV